MTKYIATFYDPHGSYCVGEFQHKDEAIGKVLDELYKALSMDEGWGYTYKCEVTTLKNHKIVFSRWEQS